MADRTGPPRTTGAPPETKIATSWRIACDGGEAALGHPRIWMLIPHDVGWVECPYCDARYVHEAFAARGEEALEALTRAQDQSEQDDTTNT